MLIVVRALGKRTVGNFNLPRPEPAQRADVIWTEVPVSQFVVAAAMLLMVHITFDVARFKSQVSNLKPH